MKNMDLFGLSGNAAEDSPALRIGVCTAPIPAWLIFGGIFRYIYRHIGGWFEVRKSRLPVRCDLFCIWKMYYPIFSTQDVPKVLYCQKNIIQDLTKGVDSMERELIFHILEIDGLTDERDIKAAYMKKLKATNPEDDPEGFRRLREAYEQALVLLREEKESALEEEEEKTELDLWIEKTDEIYRDFRSRGDVKAWKELLDAEICQGLDTALDARDAMLVYLLSHFYLPREIWQILDREFQFTEDYETLKERFPADFLDYVKHYVECEYFVDFSRMTVRGEDSAQNTDINVDAYIRGYMELRGLCDQQDYDGAKKKLSELAAYGVWYPWEEAEKIKIMLAQGKLQEASDLADWMYSFWPENGYMVSMAAEAKWNVGEKETAFGWWSQVPDAYGARTGMIRYYLESEETAEKAKEMALDLWEEDGSGQRADEYIERANEILLQRYKKQIAGLTEEEEKDAVRVEMAWCEYQNKHAEEAIRILDDITPGESAYYSYHNLKGRVLAALDRNKEAIPELRLWLSMIEQTVEDGSEESVKRLRRKGTACLMLGICLSREKKYEEAAEFLKRAEEETDDLYDKLGAMSNLAQVWLSLNEYEKAVDECERIFAIDAGYYPAYLTRQEAYFEMRNAQGVVDDYHHAVEIYAGHYKPYLLAIQVFLIYDQYEDAKQTIERALENQVEFSDKMKYFHAKTLRYLSEGEKDRQKPLQILQELKTSISANANETDMEDLSEIDFEIALLYWDDDKYDDALANLAEAIRKNPSKGQHFMVKAEILRGKGEFTEALGAYAAAKEEYDETAGYYYGIGCCHSELGNEDQALENFLEAVKWNAVYRDVNEKIADIYMERYKRTCAVKEYKQAIHYADLEVQNQENCYILVHRGLMYRTAMRLQKAIKDFEKALTYQPEDWAAYNNIGYSYKHMGEYEKSIEMYEKSLEMLNRHGERRVLPYSNMADCYEILGEYEKAIVCYQKDLEWYPDRTVFYEEIGDLYFYLKDYERAVSAYETAGSRWNDKEHLLKIGDVLFVQGMVRKAKSYYKKAIQTADIKEDAYIRHSDYAERLMNYFFDYAGAVRILEKAARGYENGGWNASRLSRAGNERFLARAYYLLRRYKKAEEHARKAYDLYLADASSEEAYLAYPSKRALHLSRIGECCLYMGNTDKAYELFQLMDAGYRCEHCRNGACYEKYRNMGLYYLCLGTSYKKEALECYEKAFELCPVDLELEEMVKKLRKEIR